MENNENHWQTIFQEKDTSKVSWYQESQTKAISLFRRLGISASDAIIDIGGGDSNLPDALISEAYQNITVLDISSSALSISKERLGEESQKINWVASNVLNYQSANKYNVWFDRAVFHFLSEEVDRLKYKSSLSINLQSGGIAIIGGFSKNGGPTKCSNIEVYQLDEKRMNNIFNEEFKVIETYEDHHKTPSSKLQKFFWTIMIKK